MTDNRTLDLALTAHSRGDLELDLPLERMSSAERLVARVRKVLIEGEQRNWRQPERRRLGGGQWKR